MSANNAKCNHSTIRLATENCIIVVSAVLTFKLVKSALEGGGGGGLGGWKTRFHVHRFQGLRRRKPQIAVSK